MFIAIILLQMWIIYHLCNTNKITIEKEKEMMAKSEFAEMFEAFEKDMIYLYHKIRTDKLRATDYIDAKHYTPAHKQLKHAVKRAIHIKFYRGKRYKGGRNV